MSQPLAAILVVSATACASPAAAPAPVGAPAASGTQRICQPSATFCEDFSNVAEGALPDGWLGGDGLAVKQDGRKRLLAAFESRDEYAVAIPSWRALGDFRVDWMLKPDPGSLWFTHYKLRAGDVEMTLAARPPNMDDGDASVSLNSSTERIPYIGKAQVLVSLLREGPVYRVFVNGKRVLLARYATESVEGVSISVSNAGRGFGVFAISMTTKDQPPAASSEPKIPCAPTDPLCGAKP